MFSEYLKARPSANEPLSNDYTNEDSQHQNQNILPFRKLKLSAIINKKQSNSRLSKMQRKNFAKDCILAMGDWTASNIKPHDPIRGKGMRRMLRKQGFSVHLIDEYKTSSFCPKCKDGKLKKFIKITNPRSFRRAKSSTAECHRLLW